MSTSEASPSTSTTNNDQPSPKPKRPLSGYHLFHRYKRNMVLNATTHSLNNINCLNSNATTGIDFESTIRNIIAALPGLEGIPSDHVIWTLSPANINELRASNIRIAMEGKLFPSEIKRKHRKVHVHGLGLFGMNKIMNEMWARVDGFTKQVFGELFDVGNIRYHRLLVEYDVGRIRHRRLLAECKMRDATVEQKSLMSPTNEKACEPVKKTKQVKRKRSPQEATTASNVAATTNGLLVTTGAAPMRAKETNVRAFDSTNASHYPRALIAHHNYLRSSKLYSYACGHNGHMYLDSLQPHSFVSSNSPKKTPISERWVSTNLSVSNAVPPTTTASSIKASRKVQNQFHPLLKNSLQVSTQTQAWNSITNKISLRLESMSGSSKKYFEEGII